MRLILILLFVLVSCSKNSEESLNFTILSPVNSDSGLWQKISGIPKFNTKIHSDGCSGGMSALYSELTFLHKNHGKTLEWRKCCEIHDLAYYYGGIRADKKQADAQLSQCVTQVLGNQFLGKAMQAAVEIGGGPYLPTPYRWGYGEDFRIN